MIHSAVGGSNRCPFPDLTLTFPVTRWKQSSPQVYLQPVDLPLINKPNAKTTLNIRLFYLHSSCIYPDILFKTLTNSSDVGGKKNPEEIL